MVTNSELILQTIAMIGFGKKRRGI